MAELDLAVGDKAGGLGDGVEGGLAVRVELLAEDGMLGSCFSLALAFAAGFFAMAGMMPEEEAMPVKFFGDGRSNYSCQEAHIPFSAA